MCCSSFMTGVGKLAMVSSRWQADGKLLERSLVDTAVHGPERLVFEAKPNRVTTAQ